MHHFSCVRPGPRCARAVKNSADLFRPYDAFKRQHHAKRSRSTDNVTAARSVGDLSLDITPARSAAMLGRQMVNQFADVGKRFELRRPGYGQRPRQLAGPVGVERSISFDRVRGDIHGSKSRQALTHHDSA